MTPPDGMPPDALRELVREVLRDLLPTLANGAAPPPGPGIPLARPSGIPPAPPPGIPLARPSGIPPAPPSGIPATSPAAPPAPPSAQATWPAEPIRAASRDGAALRPVRLATDEELHAFVLRVIALADNPKRRRDLLAGRLRFTLAPVAPTAAPSAAAAPTSATSAGRVPATPTAVGHARVTPTAARGAPVTPAASGRAPVTLTPSGRARVTPAPSGRAPVTLTASGRAPATAISGDHRIEKGAVTERAVQAAASAGARLVLGPRAVLTPLARDRARALGVPIEKER
jgi:hypothetical protein